MLLHKNKRKKRKSKKTIYSKPFKWLLSAHETAELMRMSDVGVYQGRKKRPEKWHIIDIGLFCFKHSLTKQVLVDIVQTSGQNDRP